VIVQSLTLAKLRRELAPRLFRGRARDRQGFDTFNGLFSSDN
jgi:hypothetical protein